MKTLVLLLLSTMCLGQQGTPPMSTPWQSPNHPEHASAQPMQPEQSLLGSGYTADKGEQPLADAYRRTPEVPLGTIAKICREDANDQRCIYKGGL